MIIAVANQKGGVGKTTTAVNTSAAIAKAGRRVLLVDADPQGNATSGVGFEKSTEKNSIYDVLINEMPASEAVYETSVDGLFLMPSNIDLVGAEVELVSMMLRETVFSRAINEIKASFDYIIIDCPPSLGLITINMLAASDRVLIPIQCEYYALEGLSQLVNTINLVRRHINSSLELEGVVLTMFDSRTNLSEQVADEVRKYFENKLHNIVVPRNVRLGEAPSFGLPITEYDARCVGAVAYEALASEIMENNCQC